MTEQERIKEILRLDCENQHFKYYQEGYRESMLTQIHGEDKVWDKLKIDVERYSPDSARRISYEQGWNDAVSDYGINDKTNNSTCYIMHRTADDLTFVTLDKEYADRLYESGEYIMKISQFNNRNYESS